MPDKSPFVIGFYCPECGNVFTLSGNTMVRIEMSRACIQCPKCNRSQPISAAQCLAIRTLWGIKSVDGVKLFPQIKPSIDFDKLYRELYGDDTK